VRFRNLLEAAGVELRKRFCFCNLQIPQDRKNLKIDDSQSHRTVIVQSDSNSSSAVRFPEVHANPDIDIIAFYNSYLATYFEHDVRSVVPRCQSGGFRALPGCALRSSNLLNKTDFARDVGIAITGCPRWKSPVRSRSWSRGSPAAPGFPLGNA
jgi:hypothetical protein